MTQRGNDGQGAPSVLTEGQTTHVAARPLARRAEAVVAGQKEALELVLTGAPLETALGALVHTVQVQCQPGTLAAIFSVDDRERCLRQRAGGSLLAPLCQALDGSDAASEATGPCGQSLLALEAIGVADLQRVPAEWPAFCALAQEYGVQSCWVLPVLNGDRHPLGLLLLCWREPHAVSEDDMAVAREVAHTAAVLLERERLDRQSAAQREDFLASLAHDLRNPLAPLSNALELMARSGNNEAVMVRARSIMARQLAQLARLIDELSAVSHGKVPMPPAAGAAAAPQPAEPAQSSGESQAGPASNRVLVADDNDLVRESFVELLESEGYEVRTAVDGLQAIEIAEQWRPRVVLLDIHMPGLSGLETARRLRAVHPSHAMTLLMMSGMTLNDAWLRHAKAAGFDDCLDKTADPRAWLARVRLLAAP